MNYYIKGDAAKAEQIRATFEAKGFNTLGINFENKTLLYFSFEGCIKHCSDDWFFTHLIKTHPDYKELELSVQPKFKVGDEIVWTEPKGNKPAEPVKIIQLIDKDQLYMVDMSNGVGYVSYDMQDYYKLVPKKHYDISSFYAGMPVLVRETSLNAWQYVLFSHCYVGGDGLTRFNAGLVGFTQCIPFNNKTKHLLGTTGMPSEEFINW